MQAKGKIITDAEDIVDSHKRRTLASNVYGWHVHDVHMIHLSLCRSCCRNASERRKKKRKWREKKWKRMPFKRTSILLMSAPRRSKRSGPKMRSHLQSG